MHNDVKLIKPDRHFLSDINDFSAIKEKSFFECFELSDKTTTTSFADIQRDIDIQTWRSYSAPDFSNRRQNVDRIEELSKSNHLLAKELARKNWSQSISREITSPTGKTPERAMKSAMHPPKGRGRGRGMLLAQQVQALY